MKVYYIGGKDKTTLSGDRFFNSYLITNQSGTQLITDLRLGILIKFTETLLQRKASLTPLRSFYLAVRLTLNEIDYCLFETILRQHRLQTKLAGLWKQVIGTRACGVQSA